MTRINNCNNIEAFNKMELLDKQDKVQSNIKSLLQQVESQKFDPLNLDMQLVKAKDKPKDNSSGKKNLCSTQQYLPTQYQGVAPKPQPKPQPAPKKK